MFESGYYPPGAQYDSNAPYNEEKQREIEIEVTVSITLSKTLKIMVDDYVIESDPDGGCQLDFSQCDLKRAVESQYILPQDTYKDWDIDDYEILL